MKAPRQTIAILTGLLLAAAAHAQPGLPRIVQLPTDDFVYQWGENVSIDDRERPDFDINGDEVPFACNLTGSFRAGSRMRDYYNQRNFELSLQTSINFIQDATYTLNELYLDNQLSWAILDCVIPDTTDDEEAIQERVDRALERAERQRERRRERAARDEED